MKKLLGGVLAALFWVWAGAAWALVPAGAGLDYQAHQPGYNAGALYEQGFQPVAASGQLVATQWTEFIDSQGNWGARGQVLNNGNSRVWFAEIDVDLLDKNSGRKLASKFSFVNGDAARTSSGVVTDTTIAPGDTVTFDILYTGLAASQVKAGAKHFSWYNYAGQPTHAELNLSQFTQYTYRGEMAARGTVQNSGWDWAYFAQVRADAFDVAGNYIGGDYAFVDGQTATINTVTTGTAISPGGSAGFDIRWTGIPASDVAWVKTHLGWKEK
ncbi:MAG: hypothetical protein V1806_12755 [Pseudomonadota bacterium]